MPVFIQGTPSNDVLLDQVGWTVLFGRAGNDSFVAHETDFTWIPHPGGGGHYGFEVDHFDGGAGTDYLHYEASATSIMGDLAAGVIHRWANGVTFAPDFVSNIENVIGSFHNDALLGDQNANYIFGMSGNDQIWGREGNDTLAGGSGNDTLAGDAGNDTMLGHDDDDEMHGGTGNDTMYGHAGDDTIKGGDNNDTIYGGDDNDTIDGGYGFDLISGGDGNDVVDGGSGNDIIDGDDGHDNISGGSGNDVVNGGSGNDVLDPGTGNDTVHGSTGGDRIMLKSAFDVEVNLGTGSASFGANQVAMTSIEHVTTGTGEDMITGSFKANGISSGDGDDTIDAQSGNDIVYSGTGDDFVELGDGNDKVYASTGNDTMYGGSGDDTMYGQSNHDWFYGGSGFNDIFTGTGNDVVAYNDDNKGLNHIKDFDVANDKLWFGHNFFAGPATADLAEVLEAIEVGGTTFLQADTTTSGLISIARFDGVSADALNAMIEDESILHTIDIGIGGGDWAFG